MSIFGWSYPAGCSGTPYDDEGVCDGCHYGTDHCICEEEGAAPSRITVGEFIAYIGVASTLSETLWAIDKHNAHHVWLVVGGTRLYYHSPAGRLNEIPPSVRIDKVGAGCIARDGSDWEFSTERPAATVKDIDTVRAACESALADHQIEE